MSLSSLEREELEARASELGLAFDDPAVIAAKLAEWAREYLPNKVTSALWITAKRERDEGILVELHELTLADRVKVRLGGLIGRLGAGVAGVSDVWRSSAGVTVAVGLGAVVRYTDLRGVEPVFVCSIRF